MSWCRLQLVLSQIHSIHISVFTSLSYPKFITQFISRHLLQLVLSQIHHPTHISVFTSLSYPKFITQFISRHLLQLVLSQIHHSIHVLGSSPACSIPNSPLNSYLSVFIFTNSFYNKSTTQFIFRCLLQLVLSQIHHSIHILVSSPACSIPNSPLNSYLNVF